MSPVAIWHGFCIVIVEVQVRGQKILKVVRGGYTVNAKVHVFDVAIDDVNLNEAATLLGAAAADKSSVTSVAFVNADCLNMACTDAGYANLLARQDFVFGDGAGVRYACKLDGQPVQDNVNGTDLYPLLCEQALAQGLSIYLLGGKPGVAERAAARTKRRYPGLKLAGTQHGFLNAADQDQVVSDINASGADILLVALGAPHQERWIEIHQAQLQVGVAVGVGGLLDFVAREVSRAPSWVRKLGFEWVVRFMQEPTRLLRRYFVGNPLFLYRVLRQILHKRLNRLPVVNTTSGVVGARRAVTKRFDSWRDFEVLDRVEAKYQGLAQGARRPGLMIARLQRRLAFTRLTQNYAVIKRGLDICASGMGLLILLPVFLVTALCIYLNDPGPVFYAQIRVGLRGRTFKMLKFRSMVVDAEKRLAQLQAVNESAAGVLFKIKSDPRITGVGRFIRRYSVDELPQLLNVLRGDMSLVGPRPPLPAEVALYSLSDRQRLEVLPGITCLWQVSGRSDIDFIGQVKLDRDYIKQQALSQDLKIIIRTVPAVLGAKGAY
jgi:exopolysaccharide biosynthesis WecB/TagA/CpsF family protein